MPFNAVLSDEAVKNILSPFLRVPDDLFRDTSYISPFAHPSQPQPILLLTVCKQWLRVATPLLYHDVVIRSEAQAQALEYTLTKKKDLGACIKRLRVEGGYGQWMHNIIRASPNITELFLSLDLCQSDNVSGLVTGLPLIKPTRVTLREWRNSDRNNKATRSVTEALCACIQTWSTLETFDSPYDEHHGLSTRAEAVAEALSKSPSLNTLYIPPLLCSADNLSTIAQNPHLQRICVKPLPTRREALEDLLGDRGADAALDPDAEYVKDWTPKIFEERKAYIEEDDRVRSLLVFSEADDRVRQTPSTSNSCYIPMHAASDDVKEYIWSRVLFFALGSETLSVKKLGCRAFCRSQQLRLNRMHYNIATVSNLFWRLSEPYLFRDPLLLGGRAINRFRDFLINKPSRASFIRTITYNARCGRGLYGDPFDALGRIFSLASNVVSVRQTAHEKSRYDYDESHKRRKLLPSDILSRFPEDTAHRVEELSGMFIELSRDRPSFGFLTRFCNLKELRLQCVSRDPPRSKAARKEEGTLQLSVRLPRDSFSKLETLGYAENYTVPYYWHVAGEYDTEPDEDYENFDDYDDGEGYGDREDSEDDDSNDEDHSDQVDRNPSLLGEMAKLKLPSIRELDICLPFYDYGDYRLFLTKHGSKLQSITLSCARKNLSPFQFCKNLKSFRIVLDDTEGYPKADFFRVSPSTAPDLFSPSPSHTTVDSLQKITIVDPVIEYTNVERSRQWGRFFETVDFSGFPSLKEFQVISCRWPINEREIREGKNPWVKYSESLWERCAVRLTDAQGRHWIPRLALKIEVTEIKETTTTGKKKKRRGRKW